MPRTLPRLLSCIFGKDTDPVLTSIVAEHLGLTQVPTTDEQRAFHHAKLGITITRTFSADSAPLHLFYPVQVADDSQPDAAPWAGYMDHWLLLAEQGKAFAQSHVDLQSLIAWVSVKLGWPVAYELCYETEPYSLLGAEFKASIANIYDDTLREMARLLCAMLRAGGTGLHYTEKPLGITGHNLLPVELAAHGFDLAQHLGFREIAQQGFLAVRVSLLPPAPSLRGGREGYRVVQHNKLSYGMCASYYLECVHVDAVAMSLPQCRFLVWWERELLYPYANDVVVYWESSRNGWRSCITVQDLLLRDARFVDWLCHHQPCEAAEALKLSVIAANHAGCNAWGVAP